MKICKGSCKKSSFPNGQATKREGGGLYMCATKEKITFLFKVRKTVPMATKPKEAGAGPPRK